MTVSHAILDVASRNNKAEKIERLVSRESKLRMHNMLEVGCGSGFITLFFSNLGYGADSSFAIDINDERQVDKGFQFQRVENTALPFPNDNFDFIISNHVIEHVGNRDSQEHHLQEVFRCLEPGGTLYFAVPNRWQVIEPHYKLPFLSWFPKGFASIFVRLFRCGSHYDCVPLSRIEAAHLLKNAGFVGKEVTLDAIPLVGEIEGGFLTRRITSLPKAFWKLFHPIIPTLIFVCRKPAA